ncbi:type 2 adenylate kinase [Reticulomyxa filosa]|uniref:Type 2 adenylate kinase n=1 Tax=Reticulomyxa filosa TaxID=46433 RepID=X6N4K1_RETFI|nr:type 2 adenylate kinase [Reticulomyxa filosa]|eukprot:ETO20838.1 type 2 adenylate kinase [Reticulomyxa filosa]
MLRTAIAQDTSQGKKAKELMNAGKLVDDNVVNAVVRFFLKKKLLLFAVMLFFCFFFFNCDKDGYPRTTSQARALDETLKKQKRAITHVVEIDVPDKELKERVLGRLVHKSSGRTYHVHFNPPRVSGKDDVTGEPLETRPDDNETTLNKRLEEFHQQTKPVLAHYRSQHVVKHINGSCPSAKVWEQIFDAFH